MIYRVLLPFLMITALFSTAAAQEITFDAKVDRTSGRGELLVDGASVGTIEIPRIIRGWMPFGGMGVGADNGAPVATSYQSPFRFTGTIRHIDVELFGRDPGPDREAEHRSEMGKQ